MRTVTQYFRTTLFGTGNAGETLPSLDGIRGVAVLFVFVRHAWGLTGSYHPVVTLGSHRLDLAPVIVMMSNGVDLFFVLSGFLLARRFIEADLRGEPSPRIRRYFRVRVFRILPAYYFALFVFLVFFVPSAMSSKSVYSWLGLKTLGTHLLVMQSAAPWSYGYWNGESPFWTLTIEVIFYATVPWWSRMFFRDRWRWSLPLNLMITLSWLWFARSSMATSLVTHLEPLGWGRPGVTPSYLRFWLSKQFPAHMFDFACGMTVANLYTQHRLKTSARLPRVLASPFGAVVGWAGVAWVLVAMAGLGTLTLRHNFLYGIPLIDLHARSSYVFYFLEEPAMAVGFAMIIAASVIRGSFLRAVFTSYATRTVGIIGYSTYLLHMPILYVQTQLPWVTTIAIGPRWLVIVAFSGTTVAVTSFLVYAYVERPFILLGRRPSRRDRPSARHLVDSSPKPPADHTVLGAKAAAGELVSSDAAD